MIESSVHQLEIVPIKYIEKKAQKIIQKFKNLTEINLVRVEVNQPNQFLARINEMQNRRTIKGRARAKAPVAMFVYGTAILLAEKIKRPKVVVQIGIITVGKKQIKKQK